MSAVGFLFWMDNLVWMVVGRCTFLRRDLQDLIEKISPLPDMAEMTDKT